MKRRVTLRSFLNEEDHRWDTANAIALAVIGIAAAVGFFWMGL